MTISISTRVKEGLFSESLSALSPTFPIDWLLGIEVETLFHLGMNESEAAFKSLIQRDIERAELFSALIHFFTLLPFTSTMSIGSVLSKISELESGNKESLFRASSLKFQISVLEKDLDEGTFSLKT